MCLCRCAGGAVRRRPGPRVAVVHISDRLPPAGARHGLLHGQRDQAARVGAPVRLPAPPLRGRAAAQEGVPVSVRRLRGPWRVVLLKVLGKN